MVEEAERSLHDALSVLSQTVKETRVTLGGGCAEMLMSCKVDEAARTVKGKKALAVEGFARALRQVSTGCFFRMEVGVVADFRSLPFWQITVDTTLLTSSRNYVQLTTRAAQMQVLVSHSVT
jgi:hypothetical protein